ncbi:hypothetical protein C1646_750971, partial [Rhizophagus diaphanus]
MLNYKSVLSSRDFLFTKCSLLVIITSIPSTFALKEDLFGPPFNNNVYFQSIFQTVTTMDTYVESQFGLIIRGLFIGLFGLILLLNTTSNLCVIRQPKNVGEHNLFVKFVNLCLLPSIYSLHYYEKIKGDDKKDDDKHDHDNCPLCLSHNYVHANLKTFGIKNEIKNVDNKPKDCLVCEKKHSVEKDCCPVCISHHFIHLQVEKKNGE